jgi:putative addiction module killer protein
VIELLRYQREDGHEPFTEWLKTIRDKVAQARIRIRLRQAEAGGDSDTVGEVVIELRIHIGAGYRVYCGRSSAITSNLTRRDQLNRLQTLPARAE